MSVDFSLDDTISHSNKVAKKRKEVGALMWGRLRGRQMGPRETVETRSLSEKDFATMTRMTLLSSPMLLGFEEIERLIDRAGKNSNDGYPPYNIERIVRSEPAPETLRITLAVAGFNRSQLEITVEDSQLIVRGRQEDDKSREYLHRGIAARQFQRTFVLADGIEVRSADLENGLLIVDLVRHEPDRYVRKIEIGHQKARS